jgi:hypothetical protein
MERLLVQKTEIALGPSEQNEADFYQQTVGQEAYESVGALDDLKETFFLLLYLRMGRKLMMPNSKICLEKCQYGITIRFHETLSERWALPWMAQ